MNPLFDNPETKVCPACGSAGPLEIVYGFPSLEMMEASQVGQIVLGGCEHSGTVPAYRCRDPKCQHSWGDVS